METKIIAYYLPQYHRIPENDMWWGEGFTEWTNVKNAKPFIGGQVQPKVPLGNNYYDLMDKETVRWQTDLSHKYGIYGFCYFHYYFGGGRKVLEKPAENLLEWKDIPQRFCFFWANPEWKRTWSAVKTNGTTWIPDTEEKQVQGVSDNESGILLRQDYGSEKEWIEHFEYLLPFFKDSRYITVDGKPFFAIYDARDIKCLQPMLECWDKLAKENGIPGISIAVVNDDSDYGNLVSLNLEYSFGIIQYSLKRKIISGTKRLANIMLKLVGQEQLANVLDYDSVWKMILKKSPSKKRKSIPGGIVRYDETPRRGKRGLYVKGDSPAKFQWYLREQLERARTVYNSEFLFLDAWNEWGEGNYLEPDEQFGFEYLDAVQNALNARKGQNG